MFTVRWCRRSWPDRKSEMGALPAPLLLRMGFGGRVRDVSIRHCAHCQPEIQAGLFHILLPWWPGQSCLRNEGLSLPSLHCICDRALARPVIEPVPHHLEDSGAFGAHIAFSAETVLSQNATGIASQPPIRLLLGVSDRYGIDEGRALIAGTVGRHTYELTLDELTCLLLGPGGGDKKIDRVIRIAKKVTVMAQSIELRCILDG